MTDYSADYLRRLVEAVEAFESTFEAWIATQHESTMIEARGIYPTVLTREDAVPGTLTLARLLDLCEVRRHIDDESGP